MKRFRSPHGLLVLVLTAWLAQLCLPLAHSALMAQRGPGVAAWCGQESPALQAKIAELPAEIRDILKDGLTQREHVDEVCPGFCVTPLGVVLHLLSPSPSLRAAGLETTARSTAVEPLLAPHPNTHPARGPPART